ncbi:MAG: single-stranded-DNA-specific exonuclease RecJ [Clostridiales bacterium]|nr:single-stranded-DNA-specific exonuclease RecJ [Candidatus Coliplasma caballi]
MTERKWVIQETDEQNAERLQQELGVFPLTAKLLSNRGFDSADKVREFLNKDQIPLHDPFLLKDMDKAVARVRQAIKNKEHVCIYGDYDVDGVTSTMMLYTYLTECGVKCEYFIPDRISEGYGLSLPVIQRMVGSVDMIITVDTGITAIEEARYAKEQGIDMVITDHHSCRETLPDAYAAVNPHRDDCAYPFKNLAGVGVVFKLLCAVDGNTDRICERYSDIVALGTIADVMPIVDENRRIASMGLKKLETVRSPGILALMRHAGIIKRGHQVKKITSSTVGYVLAPRINAAGRIGTASRAVELLATQDEVVADRIAFELCEINKQRQETEQEIYEQALKQIHDECAGDCFFVLASDGWHQGVIGVVASKIAEKFSAPCILFSFDGDVAKGSGRSIKGFSLMDALASCGDLLTEYGGHELAAGLSIERSKIEEFRKRINEYASQFLTRSDTALPLEIECRVDFSDITMKGIEEMQTMEPFGLQNPQPVLMMRHVAISDIVPLSEGKHCKFKLRPADKRFSTEINAIYFSVPADLHLCEGNIVDVVFTADINEYMGIRSPQLTVKAIRLSDMDGDDTTDGEETYRRLIDEDDVSDVSKDDVPTLNDFRNIYKFLKRDVLESSKQMAVAATCRALEQEDIHVTYCKVKIVFDVLKDEGLIDCKYSNEGKVAEISILPVGKKVNLDQSPLLRRIREKHKLI